METRSLVALAAVLAGLRGVGGRAYACPLRPGPRGGPPGRTLKRQADPPSLVMRDGPRFQARRSSGCVASRPPGSSPQPPCVPSKALGDGRVYRPLMDDGLVEHLLKDPDERGDAGGTARAYHHGHFLWGGP